MNRKGGRVELIRCNDPHTKLTPGTRGTVQFVDDLGTVHVQWDSGSTLGLSYQDGDVWRTLENPHASLLKMSDAELRAGVEAFTEDGAL